MVNEWVVLLGSGMIFFLAFRILSSFDKRIKAKIEEEAKSKYLSVLSIREAQMSDGKSPFKKPTIWIGVSSNILGMSGERVINKIVTVQSTSGGQRYWVEVKTTFFVPVGTKWMPIE